MAMKREAAILVPHETHCRGATSRLSKPRFPLCARSFLYRRGIPRIQTFQESRRDPYLADNAPGDLIVAHQMSRKPRFLLIVNTAAEKVLVLMGIGGGYGILVDGTDSFDDPSRSGELSALGFSAEWLQRPPWESRASRPMSSANNGLGAGLAASTPP